MATRRVTKRKPSSLDLLTDLDRFGTDADALTLPIRLRLAKCPRSKEHPNGLHLVWAPSPLAPGDVAQIDPASGLKYAGFLMTVTVVRTEFVLGSIESAESFTPLTIQVPWAHVRYVGRPPFPLAYRPDEDD